MSRSTPTKPTLAALDAAALRSWGHDGVRALGLARTEIDSLNVFPVPDGDTGTNLYLTLEAAVEAMADPEATAEQRDDVAAAARALARGAFLGARGNSGVILSQLLRGFAEALSGTATAATPDAVTRALGNAADLAYAAVEKPVEGTVLTVARAAARGAEAVPGADLAAVVRSAAASAREALARTPEQLEVLAHAGVVDAGGRGLVVLLDALEGVVTGVAPRPAAPADAAGRGGRSPSSADGAVAGASSGALDAAREVPQPDGPAFEVMYLLEAADTAVPPLRAALSALGDSLVVVGGDGLWNVHVHVDEPGPAVEAGIEAGRPYRIRITSLTTPQAPSRRGRGVVAVTPGPGLAALLESVGATVVSGGAGRRPSPAELLAAMRRTGPSEVVLLPNDADSLAVAEAAAAEARAVGLRVALIPTRAPVQALSALAVHDPGRSFDDDVVAMTAAAGATRHGEVTVAVKEAMTTAGVCVPGDVLGLIEGDVAVIGRDLEAVATEVLERMLAAGGELVTLVRGGDADMLLIERLTDTLQHSQPGIEVLAYDGGQPHYPLLVGVE